MPTPVGLALVKGYCSIDPELVLPSIRQNIEKSCDLIARGKAEFNKVLNHVLRMFKKKFEFFRLNITTMERLLEVMLQTQSGKMGRDYFMSSKIPLSEDSKKNVINFCIKCFKGQLCLNYHNKKGWGIKCDQCHFRVSILEGAARVIVEDPVDVPKCGECDSRVISATYKPGERTPFPGGVLRQHTGCILCDSLMRATIVNFFVRKQEKPKKAYEDMTEEEKKLYDDNRKKKEEKKKKKELEALTAPTQTPANTEAKKKKKSGQVKAPNKLTQEEMMNDFIKRQFGGA